VRHDPDHSAFPCASPLSGVKPWHGRLARTRLVGGGQMTVDAALLERLPELEIIAVHGVGHDGIDHDASITSRAGETAVAR
jgi:hypothetical protein